MNSVSAVMLQVGRVSADSKRETTENASERLEHLQAHQEGLRECIERAENKVADLQQKVAEDDGDATKLNAQAERTTAGLQRDQVRLDVVSDEQQQQFDAVLKVERVTNDALRSVQELGDRTLDVIRSLA